jgi:hypothetical protein
MPWTFIFVGNTTSVVLSDVLNGVYILESAKILRTCAKIRESLPECRELSKNLAELEGGYCSPFDDLVASLPSSGVQGVVCRLCVSESRWLGMSVVTAIATPHLRRPVAVVILSMYPIFLEH